MKLFSAIRVYVYVWDWNKRIIIMFILRLLQIFIHVTPQIDALEQFCQTMEEGEFSSTPLEELITMRLCPAFLVPQVKSCATIPGYWVHQELKCTARYRLSLAMRYLMYYGCNGIMHIGILSYIGICNVFSETSVQPLPTENHVPKSCDSSDRRREGGRSKRNSGGESV